MIVLYSILLFSKSDCLLVLCYIYLHVLRPSTRRVHWESDSSKRAVLVPCTLLKRS